MELIKERDDTRYQPLRAWRYRGYAYLMPNLAMVVRWPQKGPDRVNVGIRNARMTAQMPWSLRNYIGGHGIATCTLQLEEGAACYDIAGWRFNVEKIEDLRSLGAWLSVPSQARFKRHREQHVSRFVCWLGEGLVCPRFGSKPRYTKAGAPVYEAP